MKLSGDKVRELGQHASLLAGFIEEEEYRSLVYPIIFKYLLEQELNIKSDHGAKPTAEKTTTVSKLQIVDDTGFNKIMTSQFDWSKYSYIHDLEPYIQYLLILKIALEDFGVDGLTPPEVAKIMLEKFRIPKQYNAVSMALGSLRGKYVDRVPKGTGYAYRISKTGLDNIQASVENLRAKGQLEEEG